MLGLSDKFQLDIQSKQTNITPLIVIDNDIYISTVKGLFNGDIFWEDYNLSIPSIKDSINIKSKNFQINRLLFTLSNFPVNDKRFSDFVYERGLLNKYVDVYYKTQSCTTLDDCLLVFRGTIRKLDHDSKRVKIELEDLTEDKLNKKVPISSTGYSSHVYSKEYLNKPIPIVYGEVNRAPAIPYIDKDNVSDEVSVRIVCDAISDVVDPDRNIQLGGVFEGDSEFISALSTDEIGNLQDNPLYIYKSSYYQVLKNYNLDVLQGAEDYFAEDWEWENTEQYTVNNSHIEIKKMFRGVVPSNPPAFNELQCVKVRFPKQCLMTINDFGQQTNDDTESPYLNIQESIFNPEYSFDNPIELSSNTNINPDIFYSENQTYFDTNAQIPDNYAEEPDIGYPIYNNFRLHENRQSHRGIFLSNQSLVTWGHRIFEWLYLYSHILNDNNHEDPAVVFKQCPTVLSIMGRLSEVINEDLVATGLGYTGENDVLRYGSYSYRDNDPHYKQMYYTYYDGLDDVSGGESGGQDDFDGSWFATKYTELGGASVKCPQPFWMHNHITTSGNIREHLGYSVACVSMDNGTIPNWGSHPLPRNGWNTLYSGDTEHSGSKVWNLFNLGDGHPYLFEPEEFAEYVPIDVSNSYQPYERVHFRSFKVVKTQSNANNNWFRQGTYYNNSIWNIWWNSYSHWAQYWDVSRTRKIDMFKNQNRSWVLWVKKDIDNIGHEQEDLTAFGAPVSNPFNSMSNAIGKIKLTANTFFPVTHRGVKSSNAGNNSHFTCVYGHEGTLEINDPETFTVFDEDEDLGEADNRLSLIFPFGDLDISDDIHIDTFFHGKVKCIFSEDTDSTASNFILSVAPVEQDELNYDSIDSELAKNLIEKPLSECDSSEQWWSSDPQDQPSPSNNFNSANSNYAATNGLVRLDYFDTSTYTSLNLTYRVNSGNQNSATNKAVLHTDIHNVGLIHYIVFGKALDSPFYLDMRGRLNEDGNVIENPSDIIHHFLENELLFTDIMDEDGSELAQEVHSGDKYGFSVKELEKGKELIQNLSKDTRLLPKFKANSKFSFSYIRDEYTDDDVSMIINTDDIIKYNFTRTPIQDINTIVNVKYKIDYADDEFTRETGYVDGYDMFGNGDGIAEEVGRDSGYSYGYLGLDREDKVLEHESKYIRDRDTALRLRDFLYMFNCNQHNIVKLDLPIKYINLESGDVVQFDKLIENIKAYGEDYTALDVIRNGQVIYPYFIVTKITKKLKGISLEAMQLHSLTPAFNCALGSVTRMFASGEENFTYLSDFNALETYLSGGEKYFTNTQKGAADLDEDGLLTQRDLDNILLLQNYIGNNISGDYNVDGAVNVTDIVGLINVIVGNQDPTSAQFELADMNNDGIVNVTDIIALLNAVWES